MKSRALIILTAFLSLLIPQIVHAAPFDSLSDEDKILAAQYSYETYSCLTTFGGAFRKKYTTNQLVELSHHQLSFDHSTGARFGVGFNIAKDDGDASCNSTLKGHKNGTIAKGGAVKFFGLDRLPNKEELYEKALGFTKEELSADQNNKKYKYTTELIIGQESGVSVTMDVTVNSNGVITDSSLEGFLSYYNEQLKAGAMLRHYYNSTDERNESIIKGYFAGPDCTNQLYCTCSTYAIKYHNCNSSQYRPSVVIKFSNPNEALRKEFIDTQTVSSFSKPSGKTALANNMSAYLKDTYFGGKSIQLFPAGNDNRVLSYKFLYNYLFGTENGRCKARKIPKKQVEDNQNSSKKNSAYDPNVNRYLYGPARLVGKDGKYKDFYIDWSGPFNQPAKDQYKPDFDDNEIRVGLTKMGGTERIQSCKEIADNLTKMALSESDKKRIAEDDKYTKENKALLPGETEPTDGSTDSTDSVPPPEKTCYTNAGRSLGWILCPLLDFFKDTAQNIYQHIANNYLEISPQMFTGGGQALFAAWQIFQGIANIGFVIFLLVIIFSQLTGKGIDNYGVKRALPRLIIAAILINLSYFLCQIAVDLSNIVGKGVYDLFTSFEFNATKGVNSLATDLGTTLQSIQTGQTATSLTMFGILAGLLAGGIAVVSVGPLAALVALLISLFTAVVAILIVFVLLGLRQALAIILVATSPVAFVCYIFPGTQKLFTKWTKILSGILLTFPICGIMMGGGEFASKLLLSTGQTGFFFGLVAMLAAIAPLFFVPVVLRNSLAAVGNIGAKVSTFASGLGKKAQSGIRNNENYKNWRTRQAAGLKYDKDGKLVESRSGKFRNRIAGSSFGRAFGVQRNMSRGRAGALKELSDRTTAEGLMSSDRLEAANAAQIEKATQATMDDKMALVNAQTNNGAIIVGDSNAFNEYEAAKASGDTSGMRTALAKLGTENSVFGQYKRAQAKGDQDGMRSALEVAGQSKTTAKEFKRALAMDMATNADSYTAADYSAIAKQMVNGKGSQNWKMSGAEAFEWATQVNSGRINPADNSSEQLSNWATSGNNLKNVVENQIASSEQIAGLSSSNLEEINRNINAAAGAGDVRALEAQSMLKANATQTLSDYTNGTRDIGVDKLDNIAKAAGYSDFADYENQQAKATLYLQQEEDFKRAISSLDPAKLRTRYGRETDANKRKIISDMYKNKTGKPI